MIKNPTYWGTVAAVMPVIALAVVLELRQIREGGNWAGRPLGLRLILSFVLGLLLFGMAVSITFAVRAVRNGGSEGFAEFCEMLIAAGAGIVVASGAALHFFDLADDLVAYSRAFWRKGEHEQDSDAP